MLIEGDRPWIIYDVYIRDSHFHIRRENYVKILNIFDKMFEPKIDESDTVDLKLKKFFAYTGYDIEFEEDGDIYDVKAFPQEIVVKRLPLVKVLKPIAQYIEAGSFFEYNVARPDFDYVTLYKERHRLYFDGINVEDQEAMIKWERHKKF
jgi:hypothetical protein